MKYIAFVFLFFNSFVFAQDLEKMAAEIKDEAVQLYRSEMASWYGTDVFLANFKERDKIGGYFSYIDEDVPKCIFFSKENNVIGTISFPTNYKPENSKLDLKERKFTKLEKEYFDIRNIGYEQMKKDTLFKFFKNVNFNIVPLIYKNQKKIYFLSGTAQSNTILFGNDYVINLDKKNKVLKTQKLHNSLLTFNIRDKDGSTAIGGAHTHILDDFQTMTVTDICTLMLYQHMTKWKYYAVVSKKYLSFWDNEKQELRIMINNDKNFDMLENLMTSTK